MIHASLLPHWECITSLPFGQRCVLTHNHCYRRWYGCLLSVTLCFDAIRVAIFQARATGVRAGGKNYAVVWPTHRNSPAFPSRMGGDSNGICCILQLIGGAKELSRDSVGISIHGALYVVICQLERFSRALTPLGYTVIISLYRNACLVQTHRELKWEIPTGYVRFRTMSQSEMSRFFYPEGVAVFGSMQSRPGTAYGVIKNMLDYGFSGKIYPMHPSSPEVIGLKVCSNIDEIVANIDLAIVIIQPTAIPKVIQQCAQRGIRAAIVISEGFAEASEEGGRLQSQLVNISRRNGVRILGPNTLGILNTRNHLVTTPYPIGYNKPAKGSIGYCSQSGLLTHGTHPVRDRAYPISKVCDFGNKCDVNEVDLLGYLADDPDTKVICMHLEDIKDGRLFMETAIRVVPKKPVLIFKPGRNEASARAAASHTGSLAGNDEIYTGAFKQTGIIRLSSWQEFWEIPRVFASQPLPKGNRVAIITATGGAGVILVDEAVRAGLVIPEFKAETKSRLAALSPRLVSNPVDVGPFMAVAGDPFAVYEETVPAVLTDENVDCAVIVCLGGPRIMPIFRRLTHHISRISKPVTIFYYGINLADMEETSRQLEGLGLATYFDLETAARALGVAAAYSRIKSGLQNPRYE
jgi:acyl-CoA synthetase (NDP forming)